MNDELTLVLGLLHFYETWLLLFFYKFCSISLREIGRTTPMAYWKFLWYFSPHIEIFLFSDSIFTEVISSFFKKSVKFDRPKNRRMKFIICEWIFKKLVSFLTHLFLNRFDHHHSWNLFTNYQERTIRKTLRSINISIDLTEIIKHTTKVTIRQKIPHHSRTIHGSFHIL